MLHRHILESIVFFLPLDPDPGKVFVGSPNLESGSPAHITETVATIFGEKYFDSFVTWLKFFSSRRYLFKNKLIYNFGKFKATKKLEQQNFPLPYFFCFGSGKGKKQVPG